MIDGLNHITLAVAELDRSLDFYQQLGFKPIVRWDSGAYLEHGKLWLCLSLGEVSPRTDYTHISFSITPAELLQAEQAAARLGWQQWQQNTSEGSSFYLLDPDGHKLELHAGDLTSRLNALRAKPYRGLVWL